MTMGNLYGGTYGGILEDEIYLFTLNQSVSVFDLFLLPHHTTKSNTLVISFVNFGPVVTHASA